MKYLKVLAIAIVAMFAFEGAKAQVVVKARIGTPVHHVYHRRPVVYHHPYRHTVVVNRPYRHHYYRRPHTRVIVRHY